MSKSASRRSKITPSTLESPGPAIVRPPKAVTVEQMEDRQASDVYGVINEVLDTEVGKSGYVRIFRKKHGEIKYSTLTTAIPITEFSVDNILTTYGGGDYQVKAYGLNHQMLRGVSFTIDHDIPSKTPGATPPAASESLPNLADMIRAAKEGTGESGKSDMMALMMAQQERTDKMMMALLTRQATPAPAASERMMEILIAKVLQDKPTTPVDDFMKFHQMLERVKRGDAAEEPEEKKGVEGFMARLIEAAIPILEKKFGGGGPGPGIPTTPAAIQMPSAESRQVVVAQNPPVDEPMINQFRSQALKAAVQKKDPYEWADSMLNFVPDSAHPVIYKTCNSDSWFTDIFGATPSAEATQNITFLQEVRDAILERAFSNSILAALQQKADPLALVGEFKGWFCPTFQEELSELCSTAEFFQELFGDRYDLNKEWMDKVMAGLVLPAKPGDN